MDIRIKNVSKSYDKKVLDNINMKLLGHRSVAIIGKSGCGKSTLLRLMSGLEKADQGSVSINGRDIQHGLNEYQKSIGLVFQQHNLFPHLSVMRNITLILEERYHYKKHVAEKRADQLIKMFHLWDEKHKKPSEISGGQAQRASIVRAMAPSPDLMFLDEPTASLDPILTYEVLSSIQQLKAMGTKFVIVTHEMDFVKKSADYVIYLDDGVVVEEGLVDILDQPKTIQLKDFMSRVN